MQITATVDTFETGRGFTLGGVERGEAADSWLLQPLSRRLPASRFSSVMARRGVLISCCLLDARIPSEVAGARIKASGLAIVPAYTIAISRRCALYFLFEAFEQMVADSQCVGDDGE